MVRTNLRWRVLLLLDTHYHLFQGPLVRDSIHSEDMLHANTNTCTNCYANTYGYGYSDCNAYSGSNTEADASSSATAAYTDPYGHAYA